MRTHALCLALALSAAAALVGCGPTRPSQCSPANCSGCCTAEGTCESGLTETACGAPGSVCMACPAGSFCQATQCVPVNTNGKDAGNNNPSDGGNNETDGGTPGACDVPAQVAFGAVALGSQGQTSFSLSNPTATDVTANIGDPFSAGGDSSAFGFGANSAQGQVVIPAGGSATVKLTFAPTVEKSYQASMKIRPALSCAETTVSLTGSGVTKLLNWSPSALDFGTSPPNTEVKSLLTFSNYGNDPVTLSNLATSSAEFRVVSSGPFVVPGTGTLDVELGFKPTVLGPRAAALTFTTVLPNQTSGSVQLQGFGGGPVIAASPNPLPFGQVTYSTGASSTKALTVTNTGTQPSPDPLTNLRLGSVTASGPGQLPYFTLTGANAGEFAVTVPSSYDGSTGLAAGQAVALTVTFTPSSLGQKSATLTLYSNDVATPQLTLPLTAEAVQQVPCAYSVSTSALNFGLVPPPQRKELEVTVSVSSGTCTLNQVQLSSASSTMFALPQQVSGVVLTAGQSKTFPVTFTAAGTTASVTTHTGQVLITTSSSTMPQATVNLTAQRGESCLMIAADEWDFGDIKTGCRSPIRTINLTNSCATSVTLGQVTMQGNSSEFLFATPPPTSQTLSPGASLLLQVRYQPSGTGRDDAQVVIPGTQNSGTTAWVVPLWGSGASTSQVTETFTVPAKQDVLMVIDNSCSMSGYQGSLAAQAGAFFGAATFAASDFHIGVTTTDNDSTGEQGRLLLGTSHPETVLTNFTASLQPKWQAKVQPGTLGSGTEQTWQGAWRAVSFPRAVTDNVGFLRDDAGLSIMFFSDEPEQSMLPAAFYVDAFRTVHGFRRVNEVTVSGFAGFFTTPPANCLATPENGTFTALTSKFDAVKESICPTNWTTSVTNVARELFGVRRAFYLRTTLSTGTQPVVTVNGVTQTGFTWDSFGNAILLNGTLPVPGDTVTISYAAVCF